VFLRLADHVHIVGSAHRGFLLSEDIFKLEDADQSLMEGLYLLKKGCMIDELNQVLGVERRKEVIDTLQELDFIRYEDNPFFGTITEKQWYYLDTFCGSATEFQYSLCRATVAIIGLGGVGSIVFQHLIAAGVKSFILVDFDQVDASNLNRQFIYNRNSIGSQKVEECKQYASNIDSNIKISYYVEKIDSIDKLQMFDKYSFNLLVNAADSPSNLTKILNQYSITRSIPFVDVGVGLNRGTWGPLTIPNKTLCMDCFIKFEVETMSEDEKLVYKLMKGVTQSASFGPTNTIVSAFLAKDIIIFLAGLRVTSIGKRWIIDFQTMKFDNVSFPDQASCNCWKKHK
jgi:sulfur-carrier protein adenylyltransferase/sulfurtransferase